MSQWLWFDEYRLSATDRLTFLALNDISSHNGSGTRLSQGLLARMTGLSRETVNRSIAKLRDSGLVTMLDAQVYKISAEIAVPPESKKQPPAGKDQTSLPGLSGGGSRPVPKPKPKPKQKEPPIWTKYKNELQKLADSHADMWGRRRLPIGAMHKPHLNRIASYLEEWGLEACEDMQLGHRSMSEEKWSDWPRAYPWVLKPSPATSRKDLFWAEKYRSAGEAIRRKKQDWRPGYGPSD